MILNIEDTETIERINNKIQSVDFFKFFMPVVEALEKEALVFYEDCGEDSISFMFLTKKEMKFFQQNQKELLSGELNSFLPQKECLNIRFVKERKSFEDVEKRVPNKVYIRRKYIQFTFTDKISIKESRIDNNYFVLFDKYQIYTVCPYKNSKYEKRFFPTTLKNISTIDASRGHFFYYYFRELEKENYFMKDILKEYHRNKSLIHLPVSFLELEHTKNKKHFLETKLKTKVSKKANKHFLAYMFYVEKVKKYIHENEISKLFSLSEEQEEKILKKLSEISREYMKIRLFLYYYYCVIGIFPEEMPEEDEDEEEDFFKNDFLDYFQNSKKIKQKISLNIKSLHGFQKIHDKVTYEVVKRQRKNKIIWKKTNPFLDLQLPERFKRIETYQDLFLEGLKNRNCVATYLDAINQEKCIIYTTEYEEKRYTIEIRKRRNKFILAQVRGFANSDAPESLVLELKKSLEEETRRFKI
ncbi:hypothetical protein FSBG_00394 [Fusobacterium gonidiaformans 3-1-5R]|uniref:Uncharacterized protein n=1 Tax=Fusobacterium gonidiaformans 3-1-5R TaxID=469605 RepID=E5BFL6_9FUSO|nr:PcfJ domain-containing protein [Fusobacterium gonidiaformans]EFS20897.1 hypothetical protein FSBG_00394 [Fusobacterium gonidiaformans 3-1-5R]